MAILILTASAPVLFAVLGVALANRPVPAPPVSRRARLRRQRREFGRARIRR